jgi:subtilase family serine protease
MFPDDRIGRALNKVSCSYNFPTFPASSPWVLAVGGSQWSGAPSPSQVWNKNSCVCFVDEGIFFFVFPLACSLLPGAVEVLAFRGSFRCRTIKALQ